MKKAVFPDWSNEIEAVVCELVRVRNQIDFIIKSMKRGRVRSDQWSVLCDNIYAVLDWWTGSTYVGVKKDVRLKNAFQGFFLSFYEFLLVCKNSSVSELSCFADKVLYQGVVYRYLGYARSSVLYASEPKQVEYDNVFVSWSKNDTNDYLEKKLRGVCTRVTCVISGDMYGIDLDALCVSKRNEAEVVFPTVKSCVVNVEYAKSFIIK